VILTEEGQYKRPKHVVEDKRLHSVCVVVSVLKIETDADYYMSSQNVRHGQGVSLSFFLS